MHVDEGKVNPDTFALHLHNAGYTVGMFGKAREEILTEALGGSRTF